MNFRTFAALAASAVVAGIAGSALAVPQGGRVLRVSPEAAPENRPFKIQMSAVGSYTLPAAGSGPDINGATLTIVDQGGGGTNVTIDLPKEQWSRRQSNTDLKYIYHGLVGFHPCTGVVSGHVRWKLRCRGFTNFGAVVGTVVTPFSGVAHVKLSFNNTAINLCQDFGGITRKNDLKMLKRIKAPLTTGPCSPSGAFVD